MTTFYLVRHGMTDYVGKILAGLTAGIHLNEEGRRQADELAERFASISLAAVFSSPLERTVETATPLATRKQLELHITKDIGEIDFGKWTLRSLESLRDDPRWQLYNRFRSGTRPPDGESILEVQQRTVGCIERIRREFADESVALVTHGDPIKTIVSYFLGTPLDFIHRYEIAPASVTVLGITDLGPVIKAISHTLLPT